MESIMDIMARERKERTTAVLAIRTHRSMDRRELMKIYVDTGFEIVGDKFIVDKDNISVYENLFHWANGEAFKATNPFTGSPCQGDVAKGIYIAGPTGTGKSALANILRSYLRKINSMTTIMQRTFPTEWMTLSAESICEYYSSRGDVSEIAELQSLCIQDVGSERKEVMYMGTRMEVIKSILQERGERKDYLTVITSNDRISENTYGERVSSRLAQMCNYFELKGQDRRKLK